MVFNAKENIIYINLLDHKKTVFAVSEKTFPYSVNSKHAKLPSYCFFLKKLKDHPSRFFKYLAVFVNTRERSSF